MEENVLFYTVKLILASLSLNFSLKRIKQRQQGQLAFTNFNHFITYYNRLLIDSTPPTLGILYESTRSFDKLFLKCTRSFSGL